MRPTSAQERWPPLTAANAKVAAALNQRADFDFDAQPLASFLDSVRERNKISVQLDSKAMPDARTKADAHVTVHLKGAQLRGALRTALRPLGLTFRVRDGYLLITDQADEEESLEIRIYRVHDLVDLNGGLVSRGKKAPAGLARFRDLLDALTAAIAPTSWEDVGGPAAIKAMPTSDTIWVSQTAEGHEELARLLEALRRTRDKQIAAAEAVLGEPPNNEAVPLWSVKVYRLVAPRNALKGTEPSRQDTAAGMPSVDFPAKRGGSVAEMPPASVRLEWGEADDARLARWAKEIAALLPRVLAPDSWAPRGEAVSCAAAASIVVRQTEDAHREIGRLLNEIAPGDVVLPSGNEPAAPLAVSGPRKDWPLTAERRAADGDAALEQMLKQEIDLQLSETSLGDFVTLVNEKCHVPLLLDDTALEDADVSADSPTTRDLRGLSLRSALRLVLSDLNLAYVLRNDALVVTSPQCEAMSVVRFYPVFDLVARPPAAPQAGPAIDFQPLIDGLTSTIAPSTWDDVGGPGWTMPFANVGALIVSQTVETHNEIAAYLRMLRDLPATGK